MKDECSMQPQKSIGGQKSQWLRWLHYCSTLLAGTKIFVRIECIHYWRKILYYVGNMQLLFVEFVSTILAVPKKRVKHLFWTNQFNHQTYSVCWTLRRMWRLSRKHKNISFVDWDIDRLAILNDLERHVSFQLKIEFLCFIVMVVLSVVWPTNNHNDNVVGSFIHRLIAHRRFEEMTVFIYPFPEIKRSLDWHKR